MSAWGRSATACLAMALAVLAWGQGADAQEPIDRSFTAAAGAQGYMFPGALLALRGFDVGYTRSDHQVKSLFVGPLTDAPPESGDLVQARAAGPARGESVVSRPPGVALLQSFDLRFLNGDHHLQRISVDLTGDRILARLRDQNGDDPFEWYVEYSILR